MRGYEITEWFSIEWEVVQVQIPVEHQRIVGVQINWIFSIVPDRLSNAGGIWIQELCALDGHLTE